MKSNGIVKAVSRTIHKIGFQLQKKSPEILVGLGIIGVVASAVAACKATTKIDTILDETRDTVEKINDTFADESKADVCSQEDEKKELVIVYARTGLKLAKLYGPAVILGTASIISILAGHHILRKRNAAVAAGLAAATQSFKDYRGRVAERFGEEVEKELRYNIKAAEIEETVSDGEGGEKTVKKTVAAVDGDLYKHSPYARFFDELHPDWTKDAERNRFYLKARQSQANEMLKAQGHLFLNEVYDLLGFPRTKMGAVVGWIYDEKNPMGDNYVDFGMSDVCRKGVRDFVNGYEPAIILDFNVAGDILDQIATHQNYDLCGVSTKSLYEEESEETDY